MENRSFCRKAGTIESSSHSESPFINTESEDSSLSPRYFEILLLHINKINAFSKKKRKKIGVSSSGIGSKELGRREKN